MENVADEVTKDQLIADFKKVVADAEALLKATARHGGEELAEVRARAEASLRAAKARLAEERTALLGRTKDAARATDAYIHDNPWQAIGIAAGVGLVVGLLTGRR
ncbi:MAG: DUF883 family protein [Gammaproteobacteria bacterium]|nr:DUF883 family protein [Gammaproteobacteria bacterium]